MKKTIKLVALICFLSTTNAIAQSGQPIPKKSVKVYNEHGGQRTDEYSWMNNAANPELINHLKAENAYLENNLRHTEDLQKKLYNEIVSRIPGKDRALPRKKNGWWRFL